MTTTPKIQQYAIGGSIRDILLGIQPKDIDYLWVGATPQDMLKLNMKPVGKDFPVFLDVDGNEHALARSERKISAGYYGFECDYDTSVTLSDDQSRRDLTINQLAVPIEDWEEFVKTADAGLVIDSFSGLEDLKNKILRQTTSAFEEDPLRVLRTARFAARYDFEIHPDTLKTMRNIVDNNDELDALPMERVFTEFKKAMMEDRPDIFFDVLNDIDVIELYFEELCVWDTKELKKAIKHGAAFEERVCILMLGFTVDEVNLMLTRIKAPNDLMNMVLWTIHMEELMEDIDFGSIEPFTNKYLWERLNGLNAWRNLEKIKAVHKVFSFIGDEASAMLDTIITAVHFGSKVGFDDLDEDTRDQLVGREIGEAISLKRLEVLEELNLFPS